MIGNLVFSKGGSDPKFNSFVILWHSREIRVSSTGRPHEVPEVESALQAFVDQMVS